MRANPSVVQLSNPPASVKYLRRELDAAPVEVADHVGNDIADPPARAQRRGLPVRIGQPAEHLCELLTLLPGQFLRIPADQCRLPS